MLPQLRMAYTFNVLYVPFKPTNQLYLLRTSYDRVFCKYLKNQKNNLLKFSLYGS